MPTPKTRRLALRLASAAFALCVSATLYGPAPAAAQSHTDDTLHKLNESVDALIRKVSPSVVQILVAGYGTVEETHGNTGVVIGRQSPRKRI
jgi:hypothetical protein